MIVTNEIWAKFHKECFPKNFKKISWTGRRGVYKLDEQRNVEITITDRGTHNNFNGYQVNIINKQSGEIASFFFAFSTYVPVTNKNHGLHIWVNTNIDWYINRMPAQQKYEEAVFQYINSYK